MNVKYSIETEFSDLESGQKKNAIIYMVFCTGPQKMKLNVG